MPRMGIMCSSDLRALHRISLNLAFPFGQEKLTERKRLVWHAFSSHSRMKKGIGRSWWPCVLSRGHSLCILFRGMLCMHADREDGKWGSFEMRTMPFPNPPFPSKMVSDICGSQKGHTLSRTDLSLCWETVSFCGTVETWRQLPASVSSTSILMPSGMLSGGHKNYYIIHAFARLSEMRVVKSMT